MVILQSKIIRIAKAFFVLCAVLMMLAGCSRSEPIKIGVMQPLTGALEDGGKGELAGIRLAHSLKHEVLGREVELIVYDNESLLEKSVEHATELVTKDKVSAVLGSWGSPLSIAAGDIMKQYKTPAIAMSSTHTDVTKANDFYFRVCFTDTYQGQVLANYAANVLNAGSAVIVQESGNSYSEGLSAVFSSSFPALSGGGQITETFTYQSGDTDFSELVESIKAIAPDVILLPGYPAEAGRIIRQARDAGIDTVFIGGDALEAQSLINLGGYAVEQGLIISSFFDTNVPLTSKTMDFMQVFNSSSEYSEQSATLAALGFDAYNLLLDAIERAGSDDGAQIRDALAMTKDYEGVTGYITFDANGDPMKAAVIKTVQDGKFVYLSSLSSK